MTQDTQHADATLSAPPNDGGTAPSRRIASQSGMSISRIRRFLSLTKQVLLLCQPLSKEASAEAESRILDKMLQEIDAGTRRRIAWRLLQEEAETVTFRRHGILWSGYVESAVTASLFEHGAYHDEYFSPLLGWLARHSPGWRDSRVLVNVGGNIGDTCIVLAGRTDKKQIVCEPFPEAFRLLEQNVRSNRLDAVISCHRVAIGSHPGIVQMISPRDPACAEVKTSDGQQAFLQPHSDCDVLDVPMTSLDALLQAEGVQPGEVGLVWSDTQGFETEVIESGVSLWKAGVPLWVEVWPAGLRVHGSIESFLESCCRHFRRFVPGASLVSTGASAEPQPVRQLDELIRSLKDRLYTDILLVQ